jgi:hypothetical protein
MDNSIDIEQVILKRAMDFLCCTEPELVQQLLTDVYNSVSHTQRYDTLLDTNHKDNDKEYVLCGSYLLIRFIYCFNINRYYFSIWDSKVSSVDFISILSGIVRKYKIEMYGKER